MSIENLSKIVSEVKEIKFDCSHYEESILIMKNHQGRYVKVCQSHSDRSSSRYD